MVKEQKIKDEFSMQDSQKKVYRTRSKPYFGQVYIKLKKV